ncbi:hypothetical protein B0H21DRAFT_489365 [Amylocystis lapponica]|nr:hypothetical protein B0H21DRAFT_489365 [Amylocystis lapponica]
MSAPQPLPSLPPSPDEEDISRAAVWPAESASGAEAVRRGKTKSSSNPSSSLSPPHSPYAHTGDDLSEGEGEGTDTSAAADGYPPTKDEEAEARRVAENLRRWETAERERRKAARESTASTSSGTLVGNFTRRASLLWPSRRAHAASVGGGGAHHVLRTTDDGVPLDELDGAPPSPHSNAGDENPFATPTGSTLSLNDPHQSAIMTPSASYPDGAEPAALLSDTSPRPTLEASSSFSKHPPPKPLDLPKPRSPPPRTETPHANRPPEPIPPPVLSPPPPVPEVEPEEKRWWTEWLCGCSEGADRGGDNQAGRTNPFE